MTSLSITPQTDQSCNHWNCCFFWKRSPKVTETTVERTERVYKHTVDHNNKKEVSYVVDQRNITKRKVSHDSSGDQILKDCQGSDSGHKRVEPEPEDVEVFV